MRRLALVPCAFVLLVALAACAGGTEDSGENAAEESDGQAEEAEGTDQAEDEDLAEARAAAEGFLEALRAGDGEAGCALIDEEAHASVTLTTANTGAAMEEECEPAFPTYAEGFVGAEVAEIGEVEMGTDNSGETPIATAHLEYTEEVDGETADDLLFWLMDDDEWRIRTVPFGGLTG